MYYLIAVLKDSAHNWKTDSKYKVIGTFQIPCGLGNKSALKFKSLENAEKIRADIYKNLKEKRHPKYRKFSWEVDVKEVFVAKESYCKKLCLDANKKSV